MVAWLTAALRPVGPYPILVLHGEHGSAKSTLAKILRLLIDPQACSNLSEPKSTRDLMVTAVNGWLLDYDNISAIPDWLSDGLCRLVFGGGFASHALHESSCWRAPAIRRNTSSQSPKRGLTEQPRAGIPGALVPVDHPAPVADVDKADPGSHAQAAGQVRDGRLRRHHQVDEAHHGRGVEEVTLVFETFDAAVELRDRESSGQRWICSVPGPFCKLIRRTPGSRRAGRAGRAGRNASDRCDSAGFPARRSRS